MSSEPQTSHSTEIKNNNDLNLDEGRYIYAIIEASEGRKFVSSAIGSRTEAVYPHTKIFGVGVYSISYQDIAAVISVSAIKKYSISRENTMAHQRVLEELMKDFTLLPVRFGTVASDKNGVSASERIKEEVLKARYDELKDLLVKMDNKIELGLKALWIDMRMVFQEIIDENNQIKRLRQKSLLKPTTQLLGEKATLGEMVKNALERKKAKEEKDILEILKKVCVEWRSNKVFGDNMLTNLSFLVEKSKVEEFDRLVDKLATSYDGRIKFKYVGPVPPCNFVELVIVLEGGESEGETREKVT